MKLIACRACGNDISTQAKVCPTCGQPKPAGRPLWVPVLILGGLIVIAKSVGSAPDAAHDTAAAAAPALITTAEQTSRQTDGQLSAEQPERKMQREGERPLPVWISLSASADNPPVIRGETNLPNGTKLTAWLMYDATFVRLPDEMFTYDGITVQKGHFSAVSTSPANQKAILGRSYIIHVGALGPHFPDMENATAEFTRRITIGKRAD